MTSGLKQIIIPREKAVFRLDKNGIWHNEHGKFEHPKIISYFHKSIRKDDQGYHVFQIRDGYAEKVYFPYEDTALFVFDLKGTDTLVLNTTETLHLDPSQLFTCNDNLYIQTPEHRIKFGQRALMKLSRLLIEKDERLFLVLDSKAHEIRQQKDRDSS
ncbi:MAG: MFS transporter permease [Desulfotignum sp.]|nr:MFS transporter permease [Desulfotignum sp.]MCF8126788.1 MFS transporter permease [Desulfotignum sp.]